MSMTSKQHLTKHSTCATVEQLTTKDGRIYQRKSPQRNFN